MNFVFVKQAVSNPSPEFAMAVSVTLEEERYFDLISVQASIVKVGDCVPIWSPLS